jgi:hypothetical protein
MMMNLVAKTDDLIRFEQASAYLRKPRSEGRRERKATLKMWVLAFAFVNYQFSRQTVHALKLGNLPCL